MGRKSTIDKLPPKARRIVEKRAADPAATLDGVRDELAQALPPEQVPSRSALGRWFQRSSEVVKRVKESREVARVLVSEIGERTDGDQGRALVEILQSLVHQMTYKLATDEDREAKIGELKALAQTIKLANESGAIAQRTAEKVEARVRERLIREQREKLKDLGKSGAVSPEALALVMKAAYDL